MAKTEGGKLWHIPRLIHQQNILQAIFFFFLKENFKHIGWENSYILNKDANFNP